MEDRIKTYVQGFDEMMQGGIPTGYVVLLSGQPGTMKSSIGYNILYHNARDNGLNSLYVTLEQSRENLLRHLRSMGYDCESVAENVSIVDIGLLRKKLQDLTEERSWVELFKMYVKNLKDTMGYDILLVDSLPVLEIMAKFDDKRTELFKMFEWFRDMGITTLLISEISPDPNLLYDEHYLADGVVIMKKERVGAVTIQKQIIIDKMRATNHNPDYFMLLFKHGNFQVTQVISE